MNRLCGIRWLHRTGQGDQAGEEKRSYVGWDDCTTHFRSSRKGERPRASVAEGRTSQIAAPRHSLPVESSASRVSISRFQRGMQSEWKRTNIGHNLSAQPPSEPEPKDPLLTAIMCINETTVTAWDPDGASALKVDPPDFVNLYN